MIFTFYSYKGGVGRSMALANVAQCMMTLGLRVVIVDWDLEAPGLESFFYADQSDRDGVETALGVLDLLLAYKQRFPRLRTPGPDEDLAAVLADSLDPVRHLLIPVVPARGDGAGPGVWLLPAGWRSGARFDTYARLVQGFDWEELYASFAGVTYFEWLRAQLTAPDVADVVLIDSRTGITEMGGVCTRQLADVVVSFCAPNLQNLSGVVTMAQSFTRPDLVEARGRPLDVVAVPTRLDNSELDARNRFEERFRSSLDAYTPLAFRKAGRTFWDLRIPYIPKYAYEETLAVGRDGSHAEELQAAYQNLATQLLLLAPEDRVPRGLWGSSNYATRALGPTPGDAPVVWNVPLPANPNFVNRAHELTAIGAALGTASRASRALPVVTVHGLRATGKTALVAEYVHGHRPEYDVVWWLSARSRESLLQGTTALAAALDLSASADVPGAVRVWLERSSRWLLVFDDAGSPADIEGFVPTAGTGHVIVITTRAAGWRSLGELVPVPMLSPEESVSFLARRTGLPVTDGGLRRLADALGGLPLALEEAGGLMERSGLSPAEYVAALDQPAGPVVDAHAGLTAMLEQSLREMESAAPSVYDVLRLYACLDAGGVPLDLFQGVTGLADAAVASAITELTRSGLGQVEAGSLVVHPLLVRTALRRHVSGVAWPDVAVARVGRAFPTHVDDPVAWPDCERLAPVALAAARRAGDLAADARRDLLPRVAHHLRNRARYAAAGDALGLVPRHLGGGESFDSVIEKGLLRLALGQLDDAASTLDGLVRSLPGGDAARRAEAATALGAVRVAKGEFAAAVDTLNAAVTAAEPGRLATGRALGHLGPAFAGLGRLEEARSALERAVEIDEASLAPGDPRRTPHLVDLGAVVAAAGDGPAGRELVRWGRDIAEAAYGSWHPLVADALATLAAVLLAEFAPDAARPALERALAIDEAVLGQRHPRIGVRSMLLGLAFRDVDDEAQARAHLARAASVLRATVGERHPDARAAQDALASLGAVLDGRRRVESALRQGRVADALVLIGESGHPGEADHQRVAAARALHALDRPGQARQLLEELLVRRPDDAAVLYELGRVELTLGDYASAEARLRRAAELRRGDPDASSLLGRIDELRWRLRWQGADETSVRREAAATWSGLAEQARASFALAFDGGGSYQDGVSALTLAALLAELTTGAGPVEAPPGLHERIEAARAGSAPGPRRSDRQKAEWILATGAAAETMLAEGDAAGAIRLFRSLVVDENLGFLDADALRPRLAPYISLGVHSTVAQQAWSSIEAAAPPEGAAGARRFAEVGVLLADRHNPGSSLPLYKAPSPALLITGGISSFDTGFVDLALMSGATVRLLLPFAVEACRAEIERQTGPGTAHRFTQLLPKCEVLIQPDRLGPAPTGVDAVRRSQRWALEMARVEAEPGRISAWVSDPDGSGLLDLAQEFGATIAWSFPN